MIKNLYTAAAILCMTLLFNTGNAQDTLPRFSVEVKGSGRVVVSWTNPYSNIIQLAVQRSFDSTKKFSSVFSATSPELPVNGFSDKVPEGVRVYYRIFYVMRGGTYYFTPSKSPNTQLPALGGVYDSRRDQLDESLVKTITGTVKQGEDKLYSITMRDSLYRQLRTKELKLFRDSILYQTRDTLFQVSDDTIALSQYTAPFVQRSSQYVFTDRDGFIVIKVPDATAKRYNLVIMEEDETPVLELKHIKESYLILDKTNFYHGGWYKFELFENGRSIERNKIFLPRDF